MQIPFEVSEGHIVLRLGELRAVMDTGSPLSIGESPFDLGDRRCRPRADFMGARVADLSRMAGFPFDLLLGMDAMRGYDARIRWAERLVEFGEQLPAAGRELPLGDFQGIPLIGLEVDGRRVRALLDTGAQLSYLSPMAVRGRSPAGRRGDFFPTIGRFQTDVYEVPVRVADVGRALSFGVLPEELRRELDPFLRAAGAEAVVGTELFASLDCLLSWQRGKVWWDAREVG